MKRLWILVLMVACVLMSACTLDVEETGDSSGGGGSSDDGEFGRVVRVIDGDTIDVDIDGVVYRIRYVGMNTPERDESCYSDATSANSNLVNGQTVRLERDTSDTDRYDRLLRYVYVGNVFVNEELVRLGFAEVVRYPPDDREFTNFRSLEQAAASARLACHATGIFEDGNYDR